MIPADLAAKPGFARITLDVKGLTAGAGAASRLEIGDLALFSGKKQIPIRFFSREPVAIGILVDSSGSMARKLPQTKIALGQFVDDLDPPDEIFLVAFSSEPFLLQPSTTDHALIKLRLSLLYAQGETAIFDSLYDATVTLNSACEHRKALFLITDGEDNASEYGQSDVIARLEKLQIPVYSIGVGKPVGPGVFAFLASDVNKVDMSALNALAQPNGGQAYNVSDVGNGDQLKADVSEIAAAIDNRYVLGFIEGGAAGGPLRLEVHDHLGIEVRVDNPAVEVVEVGGTRNGGI